MGHGGDLRGMTRARIRQNPCPKCGAAPGEPCRGVGADKRDRVANHAERRTAAKVTKARRAASYGRGGADIWNRLNYHFGYEQVAAVEELRNRPDIVALESEIERVFAVMVILSFQLSRGTLTYGLRKEYPEGAILVPQFSVGPYRVDFVFASTKRLALQNCLAVELDGHQWHEKTKEQVARDKVRDRYLSRQFGSVIHFTGSEIYEDVAACLTELAETYSVLLNRAAPQ